jgi:transposase
MIPYATFCQIRQLHDQEHLSVPQIAAALSLDPKTVAKWIERSAYQPRQAPPRPSKLDPFRAQIARLLALHPYSARQLLDRLRPAGYAGGYSILKECVRELRPPPAPAFLTLQFAPGQSAQVDWGSAGTLAIGTTRRRVSFFLMVLCYSRALYVEFTLGEAFEHWAQGHHHAWVYFGGVSREVIVDNCKVAVLAHPFGQSATFHPRYLDLAHHYGFTPKACRVHQPQEKGRVENAVAYVKKNFLAGRPLHSLEALNAEVRQWLDTVANVRLHGQTRQRPLDLLAQERAHLRPLHEHAYDAARVLSVRVSRRFRVSFDANTYSVPPRFAQGHLTLKADADRLRFFHQNQLVTEHVRSYDRHRDFELPDHVQPLLLQRRQAREQQLLVRYLALGPLAAEYYRQLEARQLNVRHHVRHILALSESFGTEAVQRALADALAFHAFSSQYIANLLQQRQRPLPEPGALHLTRPSDLLELELPEPDLSVYDAPEGGVA